MTEIPREYQGWWRITETSQWADDLIDILGPALLSLTGYGDRLRMHCLLAWVNCTPTRTGVSFTREGAWETALVMSEISPFLRASTSFRITTREILQMLDS